MTEKRQFLRNTSFRPNRFFFMVVIQKLNTENTRNIHQILNFYEICRKRENLQFHHKQSFLLKCSYIVYCETYDTCCPPNLCLQITFHFKRVEYCTNILKSSKKCYSEKIASCFCTTYRLYKKTLKLIPLKILYLNFDDPNVSSMGSIVIHIAPKLKMISPSLFNVDLPKLKILNGPKHHMIYSVTVSA
ncbi:hypothetical protein AGLY_013002 [Aphis glycines]|uniref:Uncharacterized protein n=1 Tax=Aphis glycines TaxID=307491 RepID=A0A6G0T7G6_APHGL|nr:hypothetical protein AGLY_013002 [Aphis glycines]